MSPPHHISSPLLPTTCQHVVKTLRSITIPHVTMSPPRHIYFSLLLPATGLQVNTSPKPSEAHHYYNHHVTTLTYSLLLPTTGHHVHVDKTLRIILWYRSTCLILYYYLLQVTGYYLPEVYRSTRRQNPQNHTSTTGHHVMSPPRHIYYFLLLPTTGLQVDTSSKRSKPYQYYRSTCPHPTTYLILYYNLLQVYMSTHCQNPHNHTITTGHHVLITLPHILPHTGQHVTTSWKPSESYSTAGQHVPTLATSLISLLLPTRGLYVNTLSKPSQPYHYHRSPCFNNITTYITTYRSTCYHIALPIFLLFYHYTRSTRHQNPES